MTYGHGEQKFLDSEEVRFDFSSTICPRAELDGLKDYLASKLGVIERYGEPEPYRLEHILAEREGLPDGAVMVVSGVPDAIFLIAQLYRGYASIVPQPTSPIYVKACLACGHSVSYHGNDDLEQLPANRVYWLCNPNNTTGNVMLKGFLSYLVRHHQQYTYVIDQSFEDYTDAPVLTAREMLDCPNVVLLHSMSKKHGIPGLRLAYITASPVIIDRLRMIMRPWPVSQLSIEAGCYLTANRVTAMPHKEEQLGEARRLAQLLQEVEGLRVLDSGTTFMLVYCEHGTACDLQRWLMREHGMLVRDCSYYHGLSDHYVRVSALSPEADDLLVEALRQYVKMNS